MHTGFMCLCTHSQQAVLILLGVTESILQGHSVLLGEFLQSSSLALLHLAGLLFGLSSHIAHVLLVGCLLLMQGLTETGEIFMDTFLNTLKCGCYDRHTQTPALRLTFTPYAVLFCHIVSVYSVAAKKFSLSLSENP